MSLRIAAWLWVALLAYPTALAQVSLQNEPKLQATITLWVKLEPLRDVLRAVSQRTGVSLRCQDAIQHEKVSIFVENRPAHEVLTQLAKLLRYEWREREGGGYLLYVPDETRLQEEQLHRAAREVRRKAVEDLLRAAREALQQPLPEDLEAASLPTRRGRTPYTMQRDLVRLYSPALATRKETPTEPAYDFSSETTVLALLASLPREAVDAFLDGKLVGLSTQPAQGIYRFPENVLMPANLRDQVSEPTGDGKEGRPLFTIRSSTRNPDYCGAWIRLAPRGNAIEYELVAFTHYARPNLPERVDRLFTPSHPRLERARGELRFHLMPYVNDHSWLRQWQAWATPHSEWEKHIPNQRPTARTDRPEPNLREANYWGYDTTWLRVCSADALEWLAWATRIPIIADAYRTDFVGISTEWLTPRYVLEQLEMQSWIRLDESGYLLRRAKAYWGLRAVEIPEDWLRPLERKFQAQRWLDLEDYVSLAARLSEEQADAYEQWFTGPEVVDGLMVAVKFPFDTLARNMRAWRFLASLSRTQRQRALSGEWQPVEQLTLPQRARFAQALLQRFPPPEQLFASIPFVYESSDENRLHFTGQAPVRLSSEAVGVATPAFRLRTCPETPSRIEVAVEHSIRYFYLENWELLSKLVHKLPREPRLSDRKPRLSDYDSQALQGMLAQHPEAKVRIFTIQGYELDLIVPPNLQRTYYLLQARRDSATLKELNQYLRREE